MKITMCYMYFRCALGPIDFEPTRRVSYITGHEGQLTLRRSVTTLSCDLPT